MKVHKDRYTHAIIASVVLFIVFTILAIHFFGQQKKNKFLLSALCAILPMFYPIYLAYKFSGRVHYDDENEIKGFEFKGENDCGFSPVPKKKVDGIKTPDGKRYKVVNGSDVYIKQGKIIPCGPGSAFMQCVGKGGYEPDNIQNNDCWK